MCDALRELMKDEIEEEKTKAIAEGRAEEAMDTLDIPSTERSKYIAML